MSKTKNLIIALMMLLVSFSAFSAGLDLEYRCIATAATTSQIIGEVQITNNSGAAINLSDLTFEYYYTKEGTASESAHTDFADVTGSTFKIVTNDTTRTFNNGFVQYGFTAAAGTLAAGDKLRLQFRIQKNDWSTYDQSNDASFDPSYGSLAPYTEITVNGGIVVEPEYVNIYGYVTDLETGEPVGSADITMGSDSNETYSDGYYYFYAAVIDGEVALNINKAGYGAYNKILTDISGNALELDIKMKPADAMVTIDPTNYLGNEIVTIEGASVKLPPIYQIGEPLTITLTNYNASNAEDLLAAPGNFSAVTSTGASVDLISQGMLDVNIKGAVTGNSYSLAGYGTYEIQIPISGDPNNAPATIELWHYNVSSGKWVEEGTAAKVGNVYKGNVSHFSTWNSDMAKTDNITVSGTIVDVDYQTGDQYEITLQAVGFAQTPQRTQSDFTFDILRIPRNTSVTITIRNTRTDEVAFKTFTTPNAPSHNAGNFTLGDYVTATATIANPVAGHSYRVTASNSSGFTSIYVDNDTNLELKLPKNDQVAIQVIDTTNGQFIDVQLNTPTTASTVSMGPLTLSGSTAISSFLINGTTSTYSHSVYLNPASQFYQGFILDGSASIAPNSQYKITIIELNPNTGLYETKVDQIFNQSVTPLSSVNIETFFGPAGSGRPLLFPYTIPRTIKLSVYDNNGNWDTSEQNFYTC